MYTYVYIYIYIYMYIYTYKYIYSLTAPRNYSPVFWDLYNSFLMCVFLVLKASFSNASCCSFEILKMTIMHSSRRGFDDQERSISMLSHFSLQKI